VNATMEEARRAADPLACFDLDTLLEGAARLRPELLAFVDDEDSMTFEEANRRADILANTFVDTGLRPGETVLVAAGAPAASFLAMVAALRAELRVAIAPAWTAPALAGRYALRAGAAAIVVAPGSERDSVESWLEAAANAPTARLVCSLGRDRVDGALAIDLEEASATEPLFAGPKLKRYEVCTFDRDAALVPHAQRTLLAASLDVVARSKIGLRLPVLSTVPPSSFAGLVAGPIATVLAGAALSWCVPFDAQAFLRALDEAGPVHLVAPAALAPMLDEAKLLRSSSIASLLLLSRSPDWRPLDRPPPTLEACVGFGPIIDLYAFGERAVAPETRCDDGRPTPPVKEPHYLDFDGSRVLALDWSSEEPAERSRLEGAAVSDD
jgi:non-ribosomal peptide synthetase component F